jgi:ArsR family transcriptional regulator
MDAETQANFEARARILKALAHPSRLFMVDVLSKGERCVCELTEMVGADISTVSKHLSVLKAAGILADEKRGMQVFYSLRIPCVMKFFECVSEVMTSRTAQRDGKAIVCQRR